MKIKNTETKFIMEKAASSIITIKGTKEIVKAKE